MRNRSWLQPLGFIILLALAGCSKTNPPNSASNSSNSANSANGAAASAANSTPAQEAPPPPLVIPAGKVLLVSVDQTISTKDNQAGDHFEASLAAPVLIEGTEVIPRGAHATGLIRQARSAGHLKGGALLEIALDSITVHGRKHSIETAVFEEASKGRGKRTLIGGGGGAALGAIIGGIAGGGKGAAIGAAAGGGAGTTGAAFTGKRDITIPAETRIHFKLLHSLTITKQ